LCAVAAAAAELLAVRVLRFSVNAGDCGTVRGNDGTACTPYTTHQMQACTHTQTQTLGTWLDVYWSGLPGWLICH